MNPRIRKTMRLLATAVLLSLGSKETPPSLSADAFAWRSSNTAVVCTRRNKNQRTLTTALKSSEPTRTPPPSRRNLVPPLRCPFHTPHTTTTSTTKTQTSSSSPSSSSSPTPETTIKYSSFSPIQRKIVGIDTTSLEPWESFWLLRIENWYRQALAMKCPFLRRRASDALDVLEMVVRQVLLNKEKRQEIGPPVALRCEGAVCYKERHLPTAVVMARIRNDWKPANHKGYYITGKLSTELYRDDCYFDGPDPDMPVHGLRKYLNAASQLFETKTSTAELLSLEHDPVSDLIFAHWRMKGILRLPWRPALPVVTGTTTYHRDADGLIYLHGETWDMTVTQAFLYTMVPQLAKRIWREQQQQDKQPQAQDEVSQDSSSDHHGALDYP